MRHRSWIWLMVSRAKAEQRGWVHRLSGIDWNISQEFAKASMRSKKLGEIVLSSAQMGCIEGEIMNGAVRICSIDSLRARASWSIARQSQVGVLQCTQKRRAATFHPRERTNEWHEHIRDEASHCWLEKKKWSATCCREENATSIDGFLFAGTSRSKQEKLLGTFARTVKRIALVRCARASSATYFFVFPDVREWSIEIRSEESPMKILVEHSFAKSMSEGYLSVRVLCCRETGYSFDVSSWVTLFGNH